MASEGGSLSYYDSEYDRRFTSRPRFRDIDCAGCGGPTRELVSRRSRVHICLQRLRPCGVRVRVIKDQYGRRINRVVLVKTRTTTNGQESRWHSRFHFEGLKRYQVLPDQPGTGASKAELVRRALLRADRDLMPRPGTKFTLEDARRVNRTIEFVG